MATAVESLKNSRENKKAKKNLHRLEGSRSMSILRWSEGFSHPIDDSIAVEEPLEVRIVGSRNNREFRQSIAITMRTPGHDFELAVGFLLSEGLISHRNDVENIAYCQDAQGDKKSNIVNVFLSPNLEFDPRQFSRNVYMNSSCGICGRTTLDRVRTACSTLPSGAVSMSLEALSSLAERMHKSQSLFHQTGGVHASGLFDAEGNLLHLGEDVGRHNALDKVIGHMLLNSQLPASNTILFLSGRASFELLQKAVIAGIPIVVAVGAPSSLAVEIAQEYEMTLVGFFQPGRCNIYSGADRFQN